MHVGSEHFEGFRSRKYTLQGETQYQVVDNHSSGNYMIWTMRMTSNLHDSPILMVIVHEALEDDIDQYKR